MKLSCKLTVWCLLMLTQRWSIIWLVVCKSHPVNSLVLMVCSCTSVAMHTSTSLVFTPGHQQCTLAIVLRWPSSTKPIIQGHYIFCLFSVGLHWPSSTKPSIQGHSIFCMFSIGLHWPSSTKPSIQGSWYGSWVHFWSCRSDTHECQRS